MSLSLSLKRGFDLVLGSALAVFALPVIALALGISALSFRGNPFFFQRRPGLGGRIFNLCKLRTMDNRRDKQGNLLPDHLRMTSWGRFLRATSLDELPQLWNVMKGEMSLVGPRPLLPEYLPLYTEVESKRHLVRPGITGWAQVNGRNSVTWDERLSFDVWYVENWSLSLDLKIVLLTVLKVLKRDGIMSAGQVTMPSLLEVRGKFHV